MQQRFDIRRKACYNVGSAVDVVDDLMPLGVFVCGRLPLRAILPPSCRLPINQPHLAFT